MTKKKKKKLIKKFKLTPLLTLLIFGIFFGLIFTINVYRKNKLAKGAFKTYGTIELLKENSRKGKSGRIDIVYFYFVKNDSVFHRLKQILRRVFKKRKLS